MSTLTENIADAEIRLLPLNVYCVLQLHSDPQLISLGLVPAFELASLALDLAIAVYHCLADCNLCDSADKLVDDRWIGHHQTSLERTTNSLLLQ